MSLYGLVFDGKAAADRGAILLAALGFANFGEVGRYRDSWVENGPDGKPVIAVYTRNGGGNRECWCDDPAKDHAEHGPCTATYATEILPAHPLYLRDRDDDFDATYATFYFRVPDEYADALAEFAQGPVDMSKQWQAAIAALGGGSVR